MVLFLIVCVNTHSAQENIVATKELETFITDYYSVMSNRNWDSYREFFTDKAILTTIWQDSMESPARIFTSSITEFIAQTHNGPDSQPIFEEKPIEITTEIKGSLASAWVFYKAKFGTKEELIEWQGYDLFSLIKYNDKWFITSLTYGAEGEE